MPKVPAELVDIEQARIEMNLDLLHKAGWESSGGFDTREMNLGFYRSEGHYSLSREETAIRLGLFDDKGDVYTGHNELSNRTGSIENFGYDVDIDPITGEVVVGYSGPSDERYEDFFKALLALGHDLNHHQLLEAGEIKLGELRPMRVTNILMRQIGSHHNGDGTIEMIVAAGSPRDEAISGVVSKLVAVTYTEGCQSPREEAEDLERWYYHVDRRYTRLLEVLQARFTEDGDIDDFLASNPVLETLGSIREGVRLATIESRTRAEQHDEETEVTRES